MRHNTASDIPLQEFYSGQDLRDFHYAQQLGQPGALPFTRGIYPGMYRSRLWTMRQYSGFGTAKVANQRFRHLLSRGQTGLSVAFDLPTQLGYDPDNPRARGEVGRVGVSIATLQDLETLLDGIPLEKISISMTINATAIVLLGFLIALARKRKTPIARLFGTVQNDILKEYIARGTFIYPPEPSLRLCGDIVEYCAKRMPKFHPISISGYHIREAGATAVQEIAFTMANAVEYVREMQRRKIAFDRFAPSLSFFFNVHNDFFEEIAKFRAARRIWARLAKERFGARNPESMKLRFHAQTAGSTLTYQRPKNNLTRVTYQALAAVLGGAQSLHTNAWDEALGLPDENSATAALRIQQIIAHESGVTQTVDPLGGSYFLETLTDALQKRASDLIRKISAQGGALAAIENRTIQNEIHRSAYRAQRAIESGEHRVVGVNIFPDKSGRSMHGAKSNANSVDVRSQKDQARRVAAYRKRRPQRSAQAALEKLQGLAMAKDNLVEPVVDAVDKGCTLGEISDAFRKTFGEYRE